MRSFIISAIIFALLLGAIAFNAFYVKSVSEHVLGEAQRLADEDYSLSVITDLEEYWKKHRAFLGLSVGHLELDRLSETLISLRASCESGSHADAMLYLSLLHDAAEEMARHEELSFENLF